MAVGFPTGIDLRSQRAQNAASPSTGTDLANKDYVDNVARGLDWKDSVRVATTANGALATAYANTQVIDGVTLATGNRILIKDQTAGAENGIYTVNATGAPTRALDADSSAEVTSGMATTATEGTVNGDKTFVLATNDPITLGTTALVFGQVGGGGTSYLGGNGLVLTGSTFDIVPATGGGIVVAADSISVDTAVVARKFAVSIGDGAATSYVVTHNLGTKDVVTQVFDNATFDMAIPDIDHTTTNTITVIFGAAPTASQYRVVVLG